MYCDNKATTSPARLADTDRRFASPSSLYHTIRNLLVLIDADLVMRSHVIRVVTRCSMFRCPVFSATHRSDADTFDVEDSCRHVSPITTGLHERVLTGLPAYLVKRLKSVLNASARLIYGLSDLTVSPTL